MVKAQIRYSEAFKNKVLQEIEEGHLSQAEVRRKYGLKYNMTIRRWIKQLGKKHLLNRTVRIEIPDEINPSDIIKQLKAEKQQLESALAQSQLKVIGLESLVEVAEEKYGIDIKKKFGTRQPNGAGQKPVRSAGKR